MLRSPLKPLAPPGGRAPQFDNHCHNVFCNEITARYCIVHHVWAVFDDRDGETKEYDDYVIMLCHGSKNEKEFISR
jgi:hypothetical protein